MLEGVDMTTPRTRPCSPLGIGITVVDHLNNQVAMQAHCWLTVDIQIGDGLRHELDPPFFVWFLPLQLGYRDLKLRNQ
jgi:hypothetical protein